MSKKGIKSDICFFEKGIESEYRKLKIFFSLKTLKNAALRKSKGRRFLSAGKVT